MTEQAIHEDAFSFECAGESLVAVIARPSEAAPRAGVLVIVGGPQYRVGSHRQFVHLARRLAAGSVACMRFDCRGMGDSEGEMRTFVEFDPDIRAAVDAFAQRVPSIKRIILWGLCDGASAACLYAPTDPRIAGLVLANPWVRTEATQAATYLRHYYGRRLLSSAFWKKLLSGRFSLQASARAFGKLVQASRSPRTSAGQRTGSPQDLRALPFPQNMAEGLSRFAKDVLIVLCGNDYTAAEFRDVVTASRDWDRALRKNRVTWREMKESDHTFSTEARRVEIAKLTLEWVDAGRS